VTNVNLSEVELPGLDCGLCGFRTCADMAARLADKPELLKRCIPLAADFVSVQAAPAGVPDAGAAFGAADDGAAVTKGATSPPAVDAAAACAGCAPAAGCTTAGVETPAPAASAVFATSPAVGLRPSDGAVAVATPPADREWRDHLGREFDFVLEHFPEEPGPREQIVPHNPLITRELEIVPGEILIGRPLGISCGCPITHCGIVQSVDRFTGAMVWCVTGPLHPRQHGFKDIGYYSAQAYEGLINRARVQVEIGRRYWFQPRMCMMQWRHSGLVNFLNRADDGLQVRIEGLWIG
jgi:uncharacterized Fe-S cluster-containing protein